MTNNPTIDGVSLLPCPFCSKPAKMDAEGVRGDDAWCFIRCSASCKVAPYVGDSACVWYWSEGKRYRHQSDEKAIAQTKDRAVSAWNKRPEVAALQSTIAQLQARIAELESGMGEVARYDRYYQGAWFEVDARDVARFEKDGWKIRKLYTAPPAPVAVVADERAEFVNWVRRDWPQAPLSLIRDLLPKDDPHYGEYCDERLQRAWVGWQARACLDAAAALNEVSK